MQKRRKVQKGKGTGNLGLNTQAVSMTNRNITAPNNTYSSCFISWTCKFDGQVVQSRKNEICVWHHYHL